MKVVMKSLIMGLKNMHDKGIMHRDIKPENIVLKNKRKLNSLALVDFGLSTFVDQEEYIFYRCGTPGFIAPEILAMKKSELKPYNEKCDIFSAGVIFYILITGESPFNSKDYKKMLKLNKKCKISFDIDSFDDISEDCIDVMKKMLAKDP